jgi:hypothetical protein
VALSPEKSVLLNHRETVPDEPKGTEMGKRSKMAPDAPVVETDAPATDAAPAVESDAPAPEVESPAVEVAASKRASLTLKSAKSGASFTFNVRPESRMKGGAAGLPLLIDGEPVDTKVSSNERLAAEGKTLWRIWATLPNGLFGYVITVPGESVEMFLETNGTEFVAESGRASRPDPKRELAKPIVRKPKADAPLTAEEIAANEAIAAENVAAVMAAAGK